MASKAKGFWRVEFETNDPDAPQFVDRLDEEGIAISVFEIEADAKQNTIAWRIELLFDKKPEMRELASRIASKVGKPVDLHLRAVSEDDWIGALERHRDPLRIGRFLLHAGNLPERPDKRTLAIKLEAGLAFGTGEHPTTGGCLAAFDRLLRRRRFASVLDMGCGTAVLAMAAAKAGAGRVLAVDIDPTAMDVARDNVQLNGLARKVSVLQGDGFGRSALRRFAPYDLIFANILAEPLIRMAAGLRRRLAPGGIAILAGLLDYQADSVIEAYGRCGLRLASRDSIDSWTILVIQRPGWLRS